MADRRDPARILIVDDDADVREALRLLLERRGFAVTEAVDGLDALETLERELPSVVLLDVMMPVMSGPELLERLRNDERYTEVPVILVTAWPRQATALPGARAVVKKPVNIGELTQQIEQVLG